MYPTARDEDAQRTRKDLVFCNLIGLSGKRSGNHMLTYETLPLKTIAKCGLWQGAGMRKGRRRHSGWQSRCHRPVFPANPAIPTVERGTEIPHGAVHMSGSRFGQLTPRRYRKARTRPRRSSSQTTRACLTCVWPLWV